MADMLFITKDALNRSYLPTYGNKLWETPNIDELATKGTVFWNHHTGAPSTIMSNICMFTGKDTYESEMKDYQFTKTRYKGHTLWIRAEQEGYECHIIWDETWDSQFHAADRIYVYGESTKIHLLEDIKQGVGAHYKHEGFLKKDESKTEAAIQKLKAKIQEILGKASKDVFLWIHIPHVINGYTGYGTDMEAFDAIIGMCRNYFDDDNIFISADHGNMNGVKGKIGYGFDVYQPSACIPLITPRIGNNTVVNELTTNVNIETVLFDRNVAHNKFIYCDSAFYAQPNRKLAIFHKNYKYIYNKSTAKEELYDLEYDPNENCNLISDFIYDVDRNINAPLRELYYYPHWDDLAKIKEIFRKEKARIWRDAPMKLKAVAVVKSKVRKAFPNLYEYLAEHIKL